MKRLLRWGLLCLCLAWFCKTEVFAVSEEKIVIALDPGHDSRHAGACVDDLLEHELVLKIAGYCKKELENYVNVEVYMTRESQECPYPDVVKSGECIEKRAIAADAAGADVYISFHINALNNNDKVSGAEVIYPNSNWKPEVSNTGKTLADAILDELVNLGLKKRSTYYKNTSIGELYPDGSLSDYYAVQIYNKELDCAGIIVEHAFITNPEDRNTYLSSNEALQMLGKADADGIAKALNLVRIKEDGWHYLEEQQCWQYWKDKMFYRSSWKYIDGSWYYFKDDGSMATGWKIIGGKWYYLNQSGSMATGWKHIDGNWYYLNSDGSMATGWQRISGTWYYMNPDGTMLTGWKYSGDNWYYLKKDGSMCIGWYKVNNLWYYMNKDGAMQTGWLVLDEDIFYLDKSGAAVTGEREIDGKWYCFDKDAYLISEKN